MCTGIHEYHRTATSYNVGWLPSALRVYTPRPPLVTFAAWKVGVILPPFGKCGSEKLGMSPQASQPLGDVFLDRLGSYYLLRTLRMP